MCNDIIALNETLCGIVSYELKVPHT